MKKKITMKIKYIEKIFIFEKFNTTNASYFFISSFFKRLVIVDLIICTFTLSPKITSILSS